MVKSRIYLLNTGNIQMENVECIHDNSVRIDYTKGLREEIIRERAGLDPKITSGQMFNVLSIETPEQGRVKFETGYVDYVEHICHARAGFANRKLIDSRFNALCTESINRTSDGLIVALRREKDLQHGPGIYTCAGGYGVHFRGRKTEGGFTPLNRSDPYDVISFYLGRELRIPEDSFTMKWLGASKCYDLSFDLPVNFFTQLSHSSSDLLRLRQKSSSAEGIVLDDLINFVEDTPDSIISLFDLIDVQKEKLPKDSLGMQFGENPHTGRLGINDDFIAVLLQHLRVCNSASYNVAVDVLNNKRYEVVPVDFELGTKINLEDLRP